LANEHDPAREGRRGDALADLQARLEAAIDEARPKIRRVFEELDARVDAAMAEVRPKAQQAVREVQPRIDRLVSDVQPRLDSVLQRLQSKIDELRRDLDARASRQRGEGAVEIAGQIEAGGPAEESEHS
jgi:ElaB/YqjD/DUF883 family membrane-anchored ribosome-binding protein